MPSSILPSWLSLSTPHLKTSDIHILDLTMTVQLLEQSTFVHAVVSGALLGNLDIVGSAGIVPGVHREKVYPSHRCTTVYWQDHILSTKSAHAFLELEITDIN